MNFTSRAVERDLKMDETVSRPSRFSKVRVLRGVSRRATTRTSRVAAWMAGQLTGSRRSRRSCEWALSVYGVIDRSGGEKMPGDGGIVD